MFFCFVFCFAKPKGLQQQRNKKSSVMSWQAKTELTTISWAIREKHWSVCLLEHQFQQLSTNTVSHAFVCHVNCNMKWKQTSSFVNTYIIYVPCRELRSPSLQHYPSLSLQRYPSLSVCAVFLRVQAMVRLPVFGIDNMHTGADACDCTRGLYVHCKRVCLESWLCQKTKLGSLHSNGLHAPLCRNSTQKSTLLLCHDSTNRFLGTWDCDIHSVAGRPESSHKGCQMEW